MQLRHSSHYVTSRSREAKISSEKLTSDVADFLSNGGQIEKLGNKPFLRITPAEGTPAAADAAVADAK